ncbi:hypothetical protein R5R35_000758 [Gryllus longicercus]|uniref:Glutathione S-transferase 3, mitochondrial n=1 Tax=Gryllus longicercus TaxID=2509291 RepID=A0AAN9VVD0_9ORTH
MATITVYPEYGYCVLVVVASVFLLMWKSVKVGQARKKYKIPYPTMYSPDNKQFNCIQRAHQNTLEQYPMTIALMLLGGLECPRACALGGVVWLVGRFVYAQGYYTGDPDKRLRGSFAYFGLLVFLVASAKLGLRLSNLI